MGWIYPTRRDEIYHKDGPDMSHEEGLDISHKDGLDIFSKEGLDIYHKNGPDMSHKEGLNISQGWAGYLGPGQFIQILGRNILGLLKNGLQPLISKQVIGFLLSNSYHGVSGLQ